MPKKLLKFQNLLFRFMANSIFQQMRFRKADFLLLCETMRELDFNNSLHKISCPTLLSVSYTHLNAVTAVTSADQGENVCAFSHGQPVCMKLFCVNFLLQSVSTDTFSKACGHRNSPNERMCAVSITSVLRSFAAYIHTSNGIYSTCRHSSGMSSGTYVHGESP